MKGLEHLEVPSTIESQRPMTADQYKTIRKKIGTQQQVADILGLYQETISRRETGVLPITKEASFALLYLLKVAGK